MTEWLKCVDQEGPGFEYQLLFYCVCSPGQVTWEVSSPVIQGYPNLGVVRGLSDMMHVKCSAQYPPHRNGLFPKFTSSPLSVGTVTIVSMFQDLTRPNTLSRLPWPLYNKPYTQSKHLGKTGEWGSLPGEVKFTDKEGLSSFIFALGILWAPMK